MEGTGWKVGLISITLPDARVPVLVSSEDDKTVLVSNKWIRVEGSKKAISQANFDSNDLNQYCELESVISV